jgi:hypothetical protein
VVKKVTRIVYDEALNEQFGFVPWGATILDPKNAENVANGQYALKIDFLNWGGADWITGPYWGAEEKIYADSLVFDFFSDQSMSLTIGWYSGSATAPVVANKWSHVAVPLPTTAPITRFYIQNPLSSGVTAWIDNLRFQSADTTYTPPPPPPVAGCDSVRYYNQGFAAGVASVVPTVTHDTVKVYPPQVGWQYIHSQIFPDSLVTLPQGFIVTGSAYTATTKKVTIRGLKPKH